MRFAYADPPYPGQAAKHYREHADYAGEVNHMNLIDRLVEEYPDGWALSTNSSALQYILVMCPSDIRIGAWVKPFCAWKKGVYPAYAWEPLIFRGGRNLGYPHTERDWVAANITLQKGCVGAKPEMFAYWMFRMLGATQEDELDDLFPGSGAIGKAWKRYCALEYSEYEPQQSLL